MQNEDSRSALKRLGSYFRAKQAAEVGIEYHRLQALVRDGDVQRVSWGMYARSDAELTEHHSLALACARVPNSIVCLVSALQVHGIGTRVPAEVWLAVPHKARAPQVPEVKLCLVRFSGPAWTYGIQSMRFEGVDARVTDPARTVADCFRFSHRVGEETAREALRDALARRMVTIDALYRALDVLPSTELRKMLETMS